jgi:hypothetical protein
VCSATEDVATEDAATEDVATESEVSGCADHRA